MAGTHISSWRVAAYASPAYIAGAILFPTIAVIPAFYAKHAGISLAIIGTILTVGRLFDAITDPLVGFLSDITKSPLGRRKPWILIGFLLAMLSVYFLFVPPEGAGTAYFASWFLLIFLAFTMIDIPHRAWGTEISRHYDERTRISTYLGAAVQLGSLTFAIIPLMPMFGSQGYTAETLKYIAIFFIVLMPFIAFTAIKFGPDGKPVATEKPSIKSVFHSVKQNEPFLFFLAVFVISGLGGGIFYGMIYLFCDSYLQIGHMFPYILVVDALFTFISLPFWMKIIYKFGKHKSWAVGNILAGLVLVGMAFLEPGPSAFIPFAILAALRAVFWASYYVVPTAMLGDIIDYDILKTCVNRSANYFSACTLVTKFNAALGGGIGFIIVGLIGYTLTGANSNLANTGFVATALILPAIMLALGSSLLWFFPIGHRRQSIIRRRIESLAERAERDGRMVE